MEGSYCIAARQYCNAINYRNVALSIRYSTVFYGAQIFVSRLPARKNGSAALLRAAQA
jgi:hypothetical protein